MWLLLLDRSGSMGDAFGDRLGSSSSFKGRTRLSGAPSKLEAAKRAVVEHLAGLGSATRTILVVFNVAPEVVYDGSSDAVDAIAAALAAVLPSGGTDIAAALLRAAELVRASPLERSFRTLLVTDGKSELEAARVAAQVLADTGALIDTVLIDPTAEGDALTRAVAVNGGRVDAVASAAQLQAGISRAREAQEAEQAAVDALDEQVAAERAHLEKERPADERLAFTAAYPTVVQTQRWYPLTVFIHLAALQADVERQVREQVQAGSAEPFLSSSHASRGVARGTLLTFTPFVEGLEFNPPKATVAWFEDIQDLRLRFRASAAMQGRSAYGRLEVSLDSLPVAHLGVAINVQADSPIGDHGTRSAVQPAKMYGEVFASYSNLDKSIVLACRAAYWALGIQLVIDKQVLRSGQVWNPAVRALIDRCDLFQLFWSSNSARSEWVLQEYLHALSCLPSKGEGFVRPSVWEPRPPPLPEALNRYHFAPLDIEALGRATGQPLNPNDAAAAVASPLPAPIGPLIPAAVVPLMPGAPPDQVSAVRAGVSAAVHFLEAVTGMRYYPVPTLLVDEHVVKTVRAERTVDVAQEDPSSAEKVTSLGGFLRLCSLWFHDGGFGPERLGWDEAGSSFGVGTLITERQFNELRRVCEVPPDVDCVVAPAWRRAQKRLGLHLGRSSLELGLAPFFELLLAQMATEIERLKLPQLEAEQNTLGERWQIPQEPEAAFIASGGSVGSGLGTGLHLNGPPAAFAALLRALTRPITERLCPLNSYDPGKSELPPVSAGTLGELQDLLALVSFVSNKTLPSDHPLYKVADGFDLNRWLSELVDPSWRRFAGQLVEEALAPPAAKESLSAAVAAMGAVMQPLLDFRATTEGDADADCGYPLLAEKWQRLAPELEAFGLRATTPKWAVASKEEVTLSGPVTGFVKAFGQALSNLVSLLEGGLKRRTGSERVFVELTPTFGIFAPGASTATDAALSRWAASQGVAQAFSLPGADRVLLCLGALERQREALTAAASETGAFDLHRLAGQFQQCVLVHEHFHALVEVGLGDSPRPVGGVSAAMRLNEALAVWMELHLAREDAALTDLVQAYIAAGQYPDWPYAGADRLEREFCDRGLEGIRDWIARLRSAPTLAQAEFDRLFVQPAQNRAAVGVD